MGSAAKMTLTLFVLAAIGGAGCGHSEEEFQAVLAREAQARAQCAGNAPVAPATPGAPEAAPGPGAPGCGKDTDCKGDRICNLGRCVSPR